MINQTEDTTVSSAPPADRDYWRRYLKADADIRLAPDLIPNETASSSRPSESSTVYVPRRRVLGIPPRPFRPMHGTGHFVTLGKWLGRVVEVDKDGFTAVLSDQRTPNPEEEGRFPLAEVSDDDRPLVTPGAVFYWAIGYRVDASRRRSRLSEIRFQRLPLWSEEEVERMRERVQSLQATFQDDEPDNSTEHQ